MLRIKTRLSVYIGISILLTNGWLAVFAQADEIILADTTNGFKGTFKSGQRTLTIDSMAGTDRSLLTKITSADGSPIAQVVHRNDLVTITVSDITARFRIDKESIASGSFEHLSQSDQNKLEAFRVSDESNVVRKMIVEIIKKRACTNPASLKGIIIISLVLGDGPGFPNEIAQKKGKSEACNRPKMLQIFTAYAAPTKSTNIKAAEKIIECNETNCCGCCGPGCDGCYGCYTLDCLLHDVCVDTYGALHPRCVALLPAAVESIINECT